MTHSSASQRDTLAVTPVLGKNKSEGAGGGGEEITKTTSNHFLLSKTNLSHT